ncbi:MAG TPA: GDP-mannose 4,6-dehydratase [Acidimicrobiales bacterium]|nr:GDP-mannose 4,6-dehydratase [Acidimicrobiales bacterium]
MTNLLITGGAGFIGSAFVERMYDERPEVHLTVLDALTYAGSLDNIPERARASSRFRFVHASINDEPVIRNEVQRADRIIHFAAETHVARSLESDRVFFETDVLGTQCVANAIVRWGQRVERLVHISTSEVYGTAADHGLMDEEHALNPTSPYAAAKAGADRLIYSYVETYNLPAVIVRPFNNYGPKQHLEKAVPRFITSALLGEPLRVHGQGDASRDWIFVDDTVRGIDLILHADLGQVQGEVFNLGTGAEVSILELARRVLSLSGGSESQIEFMEDRIGQVVRHAADTDKTASALRFRPETNLGEGLERTFRWYADNPEWWKARVSLREVEVQLPGGRTVRY